MHDRVSGRPNGHAALAFFDDQHPPAGDFLADVLDGFSRQPKQLAPVYFYDAAGSAIFSRRKRWPRCAGASPIWAWWKCPMSVTLPS